MKTVYSILLICLCVWGFISCKTLNTYKVEDLSGKWTIISVKDEPVQSLIIPFLEFDVAAKRVHGNTGCNTLSAAFESDAKDKSAIKLSAPITTMMACINMDTEAKILQVITDIAYIKKGETSNRIRLVDKNGNTMLLLEKT